MPPSPPLRLRYTRVAHWPPLAWLARCTVSGREIEVLHGDLVEVAHDWFCEAAWTGEYDAADFDKTEVVFGSGARVRGDRVTFVSSASTVDRLHSLAHNVAARRRRRPFTFLGTISTGYVSATAAVLGREVGLSEAITVNRSRGGGADSGQELADRLGLTTHLVERDAWRQQAFPEVPFIASDAKGEDVYLKGAESRLAGRVLLTGFHGHGAWSRAPHRWNGDIVRKDQSGLSLSEYRLWIGFLHCPLPFFGIRQAAAINAISRSPEMARWDWPPGNSRPICRRILEEAGLPRRGFGVEKRAASVLLFDEGFLTPGSLADYATWLAERAGDPHVPARRPSDALWRVCGQLLAPLARVTPQHWPRMRALIGRVVEMGRRERLFRYVFPWALARAQRRYEPAID